MDALNFFETQWESLLGMLPDDFDLETTSRQSGALKRRRAIRCAATLLRLTLVWAVGGLSLRATAAWAQVQDLAQLSDVALLKRLRQTGPWLGELLGAVLGLRLKTQPLEGNGYRLRLVDATTVSQPGSRGTDHRIHLGVDLSRLSINSLEVTGPEGGESFARFSVAPGDLVLADRGYSHRRGLSSVVAAGGDFLVRINWQNLPLEDAQQQRLDIAELLQQIQSPEVLDLEVRTVADTTRKIPCVPARLIVARKPEEAAERDRRKIHREASRKGRKADPRTLLAAGFVLLLTSVPGQQMTAETALELYRLRWQIEMTFKRLKGLLDLGHVPAKDPELAQSYVLAKLLAALLLENLTRDFLAFSP
jgi:DDE family transposase